MEPTTSNKVGRPKKSKSFRGSTPKQETVPKCSIDTKNINSEKALCIQKSTQEMSSSIVNDNALNDANVRIPFLLSTKFGKDKCVIFLKTKSHFA